MSSTSFDAAAQQPSGALFAGSYLPDHWKFRVVVTTLSVAE
jgi:hypothetical protein